MLFKKLNPPPLYVVVCFLHDCSGYGYIISGFNFFLNPYILHLYADFSHSAVRYTTNIYKLNFCLSGRSGWRAETAGKFEYQSKIQYKPKRPQ